MLQGTVKQESRCFLRGKIGGRSLKQNKCDYSTLVVVGITGNNYLIINIHSTCLIYPNNKSKCFDGMERQLLIAKTDNSMDYHMHIAHTRIYIRVQLPT